MWAVEEANPADTDQALFPFHTHSGEGRGASSSWPLTLPQHPTPPSPYPPTSPPPPSSSFCECPLNNNRWPCQTAPFQNTAAARLSVCLSAGTSVTLRQTWTFLILSRSEIVLLKSESRGTSRCRSSLQFKLQLSPYFSLEFVKCFKKLVGFFYLFVLKQRVWAHMDSYALFQELLNSQTNSIKKRNVTL